MLFALALLLAAPLRVYTKPIEPFSFEKDGKAEGFSIELWDRVAREAGYQYEITWVKTVPDLIEALKSGKADVAVAAISITSERDKVIDFSQPYYESGLQIMVGQSAQGGSNASAIVNAFLTMDFLKLAGTLLLALFLASHLLWWFERQKNDENFPREYRSGVWESLWWTTSVMITGGCENKTPTGVGGRLVAVVWMLSGILLVSYITASVTSAMTVRSLTTGINGPADLPGQLTATVKGSTAERYLTDHKLDFQPYPNVDEAVAALGQHQVKAVLYDAPVLMYLSKENPQDHMVGHLFEKQNYGIALQQDSTLRKPINEVLLKLSEAGYLAELRRKYFGDAE
jgi:polar amino acid transport system substrate-binding protein